MRGKRLSVKRLSALLLNHGFVTAPFQAKNCLVGPPGVYSEVYGRDARVYIQTGSLERRQELERFLREEKVAFNADYGPGGRTVEIGVSYFRGRHWQQ
jgi:hypothetical protein